MRSCSGQNSGNVIKLWRFVLGTRFSGMFAEVSGDDLSQGPYGLGEALFTSSTPRRRHSCHPVPGTNTPSLPLEGRLLLTSVISTHYCVRDLGRATSAADLW